MRSPYHQGRVPIPIVVLTSLLCLFTLALAAPAARAQSVEFSDSDLGVSIRIPDGWKAIPEQTLAKSAHQKDLGDSGQVLAGYCRNGTGLTPPYMVIDGWTPPFDYTHADWKDFINYMHLITIDEARTRGLIDGNGKFTGKELSPQILDQDRKMIIMQGPVPGANGAPPKLYLVSASFLGKFDFVRVHAYLPIDRVKTLLPEVQWTLDSVAFAPGNGFEPYSSRSSYARSGGSSYRYGRYGGYGVGFGGLLVLLRLIAYKISRD